jgi:hypothetical protein
MPFKDVFRVWSNITCFCSVTVEEICTCAECTRTSVYRVKHVITEIIQYILMHDLNNYKNRMLFRINRREWTSRSSCMVPVVALRNRSYR